MRVRPEFIVLLSIALVFGVFAAAAPPLRKPPFSLTIRTTQDVVTAGSEVRVVITLTNISDHDIYDSVPVTSSPAGENYYGIEIRDDKGVRAPLTRFGYIARGEKPPPDKPAQSQNGNADQTRDWGGSFYSGSELTVTVEPGKDSYAAIIANQQYDLSRPGKYSIQVSHWDYESKTIVLSNTITVTVVPATQ